MKIVDRAEWLDGRFVAAEPNLRWSGHDGVRHPPSREALSGGDPRSVLRLIGGWALSAVNGRHPTLRALEMALPTSPHAWAARPTLEFGKEVVREGFAGVHPPWR